MIDQVSSSCPWCGADAGVDDQFCGRCGAPTDPGRPADDDAGRGEPGRSGPELIVVDRPADPDEKPSGIEPSALVVGVVALGLLAAIGWRLAFPVGVSVSGVAAGLVEVIRVQEPAAGETDSVPASEVFDEVLMVAGDGPITGRPTDTSLLLANEQGWLLLDLDKRTETVLPVTVISPSEIPLLATEHHLVSVDDDRILARPLSRLTDSPRVLTALDDDRYRSVTVAGSDRVVVAAYDQDGNGNEAEIVDLRSGRSIPIPSAAAYPSNNGLWDAGGSGVWSWGSDGDSRKLSDGSIVVAGVRNVLIEECRTPLDCGRHWIDRSTGAAVDRVVPPRTAGPMGDDALTVLDADDRFVFNWQWTGATGFRVFDTVTGRTINFDGYDPVTLLRVGFANAIDASPVVGANGLLVLADQEGPVIFDFETGTGHRVGGPPWQGASTGLLLIPTPEPMP